MSTVTVAAYWDRRPESPAEQAGRWLDLLGRLNTLAEEDGTAVDWHWESPDGGAPGPPVPTDPVAFAAALETANPQDDAELIGWTGQLVATSPASGVVAARLWVRAGGDDEYSAYFAVLDLVEQPAGAELPFAARLPEALAAVAGAWDADNGLVYDAALYEELERAYDLGPADLRAGWAVHLSAARAAKLPATFRVRQLPTGDGGLVLDLADTPGRPPTTETVLAAHKTLTDCGAL